MTDFKSVQGKVVIVTGGTSGMGKAMAKVFAANGMKVVIAGRKPEAGEKALAELKALGGEAAFFKADVSKPEEVKALVDFAVATYGKLDGICNNAGFGTRERPVHEIPLEEYNAVISTDQAGVFYGIKYAAEAILKSKSEHGFIINTASTAGLKSTEGMALYGMAKSAVVSLTKTAALDYARHNITVNAICPGSVLTEIWAPAPQEYIDSFAVTIPAGRLAMPEEIANLALFLASDLARYITGTTLVIDGAATAGLMRNVQWSNPEIDK